MVDVVAQRVPVVSLGDPLLDAVPEEFGDDPAPGIPQDGDAVQGHAGIDGRIVVGSDCRCVGKGVAKRAVGVEGQWQATGCVGVRVFFPLAGSVVDGSTAGRRVSLRTPPSAGILPPLYALRVVAEFGTEDGGEPAAASVPIVQEGVPVFCQRLCGDFGGAVFRAIPPVLLQITRREPIELAPDVVVGNEDDGACLSCWRIVGRIQHFSIQAGRRLGGSALESPPNSTAALRTVKVDVQVEIVIALLAVGILVAPGVDATTTTSPRGMRTGQHDS